MVERLRIDYSKNGNRSPQNLVVGIRLEGRNDGNIKNHTLCFPKWKYQGVTEKDVKMEDDRNIQVIVDVAMNTFKREVESEKV